MNVFFAKLQVSILITAGLPALSVTEKVWLQLKVQLKNALRVKVLAQPKIVVYLALNVEAKGWFQRND